MMLNGLQGLPGLNIRCLKATE